MKVNIPNEYLTGKQVSNGYNMKITPIKEDFYVNRITAIKDLLNKIDGGGNIIHLGSVGYVPNIKKDIDNNKWMHKVLTDHCNEVLGIDINKDGIEYCKTLGYGNMIYADMLDQSNLVINHMKKISLEKFDYIVAGELLHEIDSPVTFLKQININYSDYVKRIIITVPNLYRFLNFKNSLKGIDGNHTENRYWYSPYTLCKTIAMAGMVPREIYFSGRSKLLSMFFPHNISSDEIIVIADLKSL